MRNACIALLTSALWCCTRVEASRQPVEVEMSNVDLHMTPAITLHVRHLRGRFEPAAGRAAPYLDDQATYTVNVDSGVVAIDLAPSLRGAITSARIEGDAVVQTFGDGRVRHLSPPPVSRNYIYWRGGSLAFGKLTMVATDLELVDADPKDPFDFSVERWNDQLVAGYSKTTASRGLKAHMPDFNDLKARRP